VGYGLERDLASHQRDHGLNMRPASSLILSLTCILAACARGPETQTTEVAFQPMPAVPAGIWVRTTGGAKDTNSYLGTQAKLLYATSEGAVLYTFAQDMPNQSTCTAECLESWRPFLVEKNFAGAAGWSAIPREDGTSQLAFNSRPLYTAANPDPQTGVAPSSEKSADPGPHTRGPAVPADPSTRSASANGAVAGQSRPAGLGKAPEKKPDDSPWQPLEYNSTIELNTPPQLSLRENFAAGGQILVDSDGFSLYTYQSDKTNQPTCYEECASVWLPAKAGALIQASGDFTIVERTDGLRQWTYKGAPLYRYVGDLNPDEVKGIGVAPGQVAKVVEYFQPSNTIIRMDPRHGAILATAEGRTLYARDRFTHSVGIHNAKRGLHLRGVPAIGAELGTEVCDATCTQTWKPLVAASDAQPHGLWGIAQRDDGTRQWTYLSYPLYTNVGDVAPGDTVGHDQYQITDATNALYWRVALP